MTQGSKWYLHVGLVLGHNTDELTIDDHGWIPVVSTRVIDYAFECYLLFILLYWVTNCGLAVEDKPTLE